MRFETRILRFILYSILKLLYLRTGIIGWTCSTINYRTLLSPKKRNKFYRCVSGATENCVKNIQS